MEGLLDLSCLEFIKYIGNRQSSLGVFCFSKKCAIDVSVNTTLQGKCLIGFPGPRCWWPEDNASLHLPVLDALLLRQGSASQAEPTRQPASQRKGEERVSVERNRHERETECLKLPLNRV